MAMWFKPVCNNVLTKVAVWYAMYQQDLKSPTNTHGKVYASKSYMNLRGELEDRPTMFLYEIKFTLNEMDHLMRMLNEVIPDEKVTQTMANVAKGLRKGILVPPFYYLIKLALYPEEVKQIVDALLRVKNGTTASIDDLVLDQEGKAPFEL